MTPGSRPLVLLGSVLSVLAVAGCEGGDTGGPGPVSSVTLEDGRDDLWVMSSDERAPVVPNGDVVGAVVERTPGALVVTMRYADIEPRANTEWSVSFQLDIGDGTERWVSWGESQYVGTQKWQRSVDFSRGNTETVLGTRCRGLRGGPDFDAETVTIRVPDGCFEDARWVVVRDLEASSRAPETSGHHHFADNPSTEGPEAERTPRLFEPG